MKSLVTLAREPGESLERKGYGDFGKESLESHERESVVVTLAMRAWRVTGKLGDFGRERESLENH